jgi:hypothetical protein
LPADWIKIESRVIIRIKFLKPINRGGDRRSHLKNDRARELISGTGINSTNKIRAGNIKRAIIFLSLSILSITQILP